jgi:glycosyltransferase involved in cell wall biosynthesis
MPPSFTIELIITTYNNPTALSLVLESLVTQTHPLSSICIADDGSNDVTKETITQLCYNFPEMKIRHVWHPDTGFNKNTILNKAINSSTSDYLIFIDGDCIANPDFVGRHVELAQPKQFVTGSVIRLDAKTSNQITPSNIKSGEIFSYPWLLARGQIDRIGTKLKTNVYGTKVSTILEHLSPVKKVWNGGNTSGWKMDIIKVNGFDESLKYGAEDVELGVRLNNIGVFGRHIRYSSPLLHLDHPRGYENKEQILKNKAYVKLVKKQTLKWATQGIVKSKGAESLLSAN